MARTYTIRNKETGKNPVAPVGFVPSAEGQGRHPVWRSVVAIASLALCLQSMGAGPIAKVSGAASELFDIREPVKIPTIWSWLGPALVAVAAALAAFLIWRRLRRRDAIVEARETAADRARLRLREAWNYLERPERFCTLLSEIVRVYLEERFRLRAPEQTTEEFLAYTQQNNVLNQRHRELLGRFLEQCDLVKFAAHEPARKDLEQLHDAASNFVEETGYELPALTEALGQEVVAR